MNRWNFPLVAALALGLHAAHAQDTSGGARPYPTTTVSLGQAAVVSQQGQRLKVQVPYSVTNQQPFPVTRVMVQEVRVPEGFTAPDPAGFTVSLPARGQFLNLQSRELVRAPKVELVLSMAHSAPDRSTLALEIPPASFTAVVADSPIAASSAKPTPSVKRKRPVTRTATPAAAKVKAMSGAKAENCGCVTDPR